jgi:hypothetical protein
MTKKKYKQWSTKHCTKNKTIELHEPHLKLGVNTSTQKDYASDEYMYFVLFWKLHITII